MNDIAQPDFRAGVCAGFSADLVYRLREPLLKAGFSYVLAFNLLIYLAVALISFAPNGTVGKLSPVHLSLPNNRLLSGLLRVTHVYQATSLQLQLTFILLTLFAMAGYAWLVAVFLRRDGGLGTILSTTALVSLILLLTPPLLSKDLFSYIFYGRVISAYHLNPFRVTPQTVSDPLFPFVAHYWKNTGSVYGPLFNYFSAFLAFAAGRNITVNVLAFKAGMALFNLANVVLIWKLLEMIAPARRRLGTALYAWNPLVLIVVVGGGRNDVMMMTLVLAALLFLLRGRRYAAYLAFSLAVVTKYTAGIILAVYFLYLLHRGKEDRKRWKEASLLMGVFAGVAVLSFLPLWDGSSTFRYILRNYGMQNLVSPGGILSEALAFIFRYVLRLGLDLAEALGAVIARMMLLPAFLWTLWRKSRRAEKDLDLPDAFFVAMLAFLLTTSFLQAPYMLWAFALLPLRPWDRMSRLTLALGTFGILWGGGLSPY